MYCLVSSVAVVGVEDRPPFGDLGCALRHRPALVLRSHLGVAPWLPHEGFANGEGGRGYELVGKIIFQVYRSDLSGLCPSQVYGSDGSGL